MSQGGDGMVIEIFGKQNCPRCENAKKKVAHFLERWELQRSIQLVFRDTDTEEGAAEGDFFDVFQIPAVLLKKDRNSVVARWDGDAPPSEELQRRLCA